MSFIIFENFFLNLRKNAREQVSLLNGISTYMGYLMPKPSLPNKSSNSIYPIPGSRDKVVHIFPESICPKVNINAEVEFELAYFEAGLGDLGSIPGRVIPKTLKMELDTTLLNTQHYKVRFKGKVEQSWEWSSALPYTLV